jgi:hypothetical protein
MQIDPLSLIYSESKIPNNHPFHPQSQYEPGQTDLFPRTAIYAISLKNQSRSWE